jgi:hypothetical protein
MSRWAGATVPSGETNGPAYRSCSKKAALSRASAGSVHGSRGGHTPPGVIAGETIDLVGTIGRHVRDNCCRPADCGSAPGPSSRYACRALRVDRRTCQVTPGIDILTIPLRPSLHGLGI